MTGHGCSRLCGWCGFCSVESDRNAHDDYRPIFCGTCNKDLGPLDYKLTLPFGTFCSTACADAEERKFSVRLEQRRRRSA